MRRKAVFDSSVLLDLERGDLLRAVFGIRLEISTPDLLYVRELEQGCGPEMVKLGLRVGELDPTGLLEVNALRRRSPRLSLPDCFAFVMARSTGAILLTGDRDLRTIAEQESVQCHGVLWILDELETCAVLSVSDLLPALKQIAQHPRCRLPKKEVMERLARYGLTQTKK